MEMERGVKRSLSESSTGSEDAGCDMPTVGCKVPKKQHLQQQPPDLSLQRSYPTFQRRESQASTVSSVTSVSEDDELDGQQLSQVNVITHQPFQIIQLDPKNAHVYSLSVSINVTSFSSIPYCYNSECWSLK